MTNQFISNSSQALPTKELALFRKALKCYEQKQYKVGLRCTKQILSNPSLSEHGETLAIKGLIFNCMGKHEDALETVKRGLTSDIKSHICWHIYGLVQRSEKKYDEAMKAYKMALRIEPENIQILRDLSLLQIQMRDLEGYRDSRYKLLVLRPANKMGWIGYASAYHLLKDYDLALEIIKEFRKNNKPSSQLDMENSELILYEIMILTEAGLLDKALSKLEENSACIMDRLAYFETRASLLVKLNRYEEAERLYRALIDRNPDNIFYYKQIEKCQQLGIFIDGMEDNKALVSLYESFICQRPQASIPKLLHLCYLEGQLFDEKIRTYLIGCFRKGIPSLFKNLVAFFYTNKSKVNAIERILLEFVHKFEEDGYNRVSLDGTNLPECPTTVLWIYYYLSQHFDWHKNYPRAHKYIDEAIKHTPTLIELYMAKAKICKHSGDFAQAAELLLQTQELDTADRYLNSKCAKYLLRAGLIQQAQEMCAKFTRESVDADESMNEMQCMWYEFESAMAYSRLGKYGEALKKCHQIERHFVNFYEDQYDFHTYCLRKTTLSTYIKFLRFEDNLRSKKVYVDAAILAASIYLDMIENPKKFGDNLQSNETTLSASELKKMKRKANKAKAVQEKQNGQLQGGKQSSSKRRVDGELDVIQPEPLDPSKLARPTDPIEEASKFIQPILQMPCNNINLWIMAFHIYCHKNKLMIMLKCLNKIFALDHQHQDFPALFSKYMDKCKQSDHISGVTSDLINELTQALQTKMCEITSH